MNKKGFTLVELMAVLLLLVVLIGVSVNGILTARDKTNRTIEASADAPIIAGARKYVAEGSEKSDYAAGNGSNCVSVNTIINEGFLDDPIIENNEKLNNKVKSKYVKITVDSNFNYKYEVFSNSNCTNN